MPGEGKAQHGWSDEQRAERRALADSIIARPEWDSRVRASLASSDSGEFYNAKQAAQTLGIDTWDADFRRAKAGDTGSLFAVLQTKDKARFEKALDLASGKVDLAAVGTGPGNELGIGPAFQSHMAMDSVLTGIERWPGQGWPFVAAALRSPVVRNRNGAIRVLSTWGKQAWPAAADGALREAIEREPSKDVQERMRQVLAGESIAQPIRLPQ